MKILILSDFFPPILNAGAENIAYIMTREYARLGHNVTVVTINKELPKGTLHKYKEENFIVIQIGANYDERFVAYVSLYNFTVLKLVSEIIDESFDFAHLHNIHKYISYGVIGLLKKNKIKSIMTIHDAMSLDYGKFTQGINRSDLLEKPKINYKVSAFKTFLQYKKRYNPFRNIVNKYFLKKLDKLIVVSKELENFLNVNGIYNTTVIHNGIEKLENKFFNTDLNQFKIKYNIKESDKLILWAGRLSAGKGSMQVKEMLLKLIKKDENIKLLIAGNEKVNNQSIQNNVISTGWLNKQEMAFAFEVSELTLVPSIYPDPFPTIILESMRQGVPVIASCFGGAKESVIDSKTGYIINPFDIDTFYDKVFKSLKNKVLLQDMSLSSKQNFNEKFTIAHCVHKYLKVIKDL